MTLRILAISWAPVWPPHGGAALRAAPILRRLAQGPDRLLALAPGPLPPGVSGRSLPAPRLFERPFNARTVVTLANPLVPALARRAARDLGPEVVLAFGIWSMPAALAAASAQEPRPLVVLDLAHIETVTARETRGDGAAVELLARLETWAARRADRVHVVSDEDRDRLVALVPDVASRVHVVRQGLDELRPPSTSRPDAALFVGRLSFAPNREAVVFLSREVAPLYTGRILVVGGDPPPDLPGLTALGVVPSLESAYESAGLACAPVFSGSGVRNKSLEAARFGRPLVSTARGVEGLSYVPGRHYLEASTGPEFAAAFARLRDEPDVSDRLVKDSRERVTPLLWDGVVASLREDLAARLDRGPGYTRPASTEV